MIVYVARSRNLPEAQAARDRLVALCPTLVHSRILTRPSDLDVYNAGMLRSSDEAVALGTLDFVPNPSTRDDSPRALSRWVLMMLVAIVALIAGGIRILSMPRPSVPALAWLAVALLAVLVVFAVLAARAVATMPKDRLAFWSADRWLRRGRPVVIVVANDLPDSPLDLPPRTMFFVTRPAQRAAWPRSA